MHCVYLGDNNTRLHYFRTYICLQARHADACAIRRFDSNLPIMFDEALATVKKCHRSAGCCTPRVRLEGCRMKSNKARALALTMMLALTLACLVPHLAFAEERLLTAGTVPETQEPLADAHVQYSVTANDEWVWKSDGEISTVAKKNQIQGLRLKVSSALPGAVQYEAYVNGEGWHGVKSNGAIAGAVGSKGKRVEAVCISLTGELSANYNVCYRVMSSNGTWQSWKKNGQVAGKSGAKLRGVQVILEKKTAPSSTVGMGIVGIRYRAKMQSSKGWQIWKRDNAKAGGAGKGKRLQGIAIALNKGAYGGDVKYRARLANGKWTGWKRNGQKLAPGRSIEAIQVKLTGSIAKQYDVVYRTYVAKVGWQASMRNGAVAGTSKGRRIEGIRIRLESKSERTGWIGSGGNWSYYQNGQLVTSQWIATSESPINVLTAKKKKYWIDANGKLAVNRIIDPKAKNDLSAGQAAYATKWGYVLVKGKVKTSQGIVFANKSGALVAAKGWMQTSLYDGSSQKYYLKNVGSYSVAKTGLFSVNGKKYYGFPDTGYIARDTSIYVGKKWYTASRNGVLSAATSTEKLIERYVQWAIDVAGDNSHGYSQDLYIRWGRPDYDCSSLVISAVRAAGLNAGDAAWTGNMISELTRHGFVWHSGMKGLRRGDILLVHNSNRQHTEIYIGNGKTVGAHIAETGGIYGLGGDQTGHEIDVGPYYNIWQGYLRLGS